MTKQGSVVQVVPSSSVHPAPSPRPYNQQYHHGQPMPQQQGYGHPTPQHGQPQPRVVMAPSPSSASGQPQPCSGHHAQRPPPPMPPHAAGAQAGGVVLLPAQAVAPRPPPGPGRVPEMRSGVGSSPNQAGLFSPVVRAVDTPLSATKKSPDSKRGDDDGTPTLRAFKALGGKLEHRRKELQHKFKSSHKSPKEIARETMTKVRGSFRSLRGRRFKFCGEADAVLTEEEFLKFRNTFSNTWNKASDNVLIALAKAIESPHEDDVESLVLLSALSQCASEASPDFHEHGMLLLMSTTYSLEGGDIDSLFGFAKDAKKNHSPYQIMNTAARVVSGEQRHSSMPPRTQQEGLVALQTWIKPLAYLAAGAVDITRPDVVQGLRKPSLAARGAPAERIQECVKGMTMGLGGFPDLLKAIGRGVPPLAGPVLFSGIDLAWDKSGTNYKMWCNLREGTNLYFTGLRSMSPCFSVACCFLNPSSSQNVIIAIEGAKKGLPLWHCSAYPDEMEVLVPCLTHCRVMCEPRLLQFGLFMKFGFVFLRLRYEGSGFDEEFNKKVRSEREAADGLLQTIDEMRRQG